MKNALTIFTISFGAFVLMSLYAPVQAIQNDKRLNFLFDHLSTTENQYEAQSIEAAIWKIWIENKDEEISNAMSHGIAAMHSGQLELALDYFDKVIKLGPKFAEGWNKRATVYYLLGRYQHSIEDIAQTLLLEPRHFGALSGLGLINLAIGHIDAAKMAFEKALEINPHLTGAREQLRLMHNLYNEKET